MERRALDSSKMHMRFAVRCPFTDVYSMSCGNRGKRETPQVVTPRRLPSLPVESKCPQRKSRANFEG
ncbi:hypothetical protein F7731_00760 [Cytobacillus depressus]|uniref:Uncharacterized protein n=1 Tax=Cytobacillus depressus TaxID=1602942 RepID=A0A6L3V8Y2_9BACI|nr:hypothetical protein F7731_00760 [Cytobacillus depressus]